MNVREVMTPDPASCEPTTTLSLVATLMLDDDCAAVPIVSIGKVLGIVAQSDLGRRMSNRELGQLARGNVDPPSGS